MEEFQHFCEYLDTRPKGNFIPNKMAGDVPSASMAKNISKVDLEMPTPESKNKGKSQVGRKHDDEKSAYTEKMEKSSKTEKSVKPEKTGSKTNTENFFLQLSIFPEEEAYLAFTRRIYELPEKCGETWGILNEKSIYPKIAIFPGSNPEFVADLFKYGYLDRIYSKTLNEIRELPEQLFNAIKNFATGDGIYARFYSIAPVHYPTINFIQIEKLMKFNIAATGVDKKMPYINQKWIQTRRALGMKAVYSIIKNLIKENFKVLDHSPTWVLMTKGKIKSKLLMEKELDFDTHTFPCSMTTWKMGCKMLGHKHEKTSTSSEEIMAESD